LLLTAGVDLQIDRIEVSVVGWTKANHALVLEHGTLWGNPETDRAPWAELDELLRARFPHPFGASIGIAATIVDSGFATERAYEFCGPRLRLRCFAGKGIPGTARTPVVISKTRAGNERRIRLALVGVDVVKGQVFSRLEPGRSVRFSNTLTADYFEQLSSERRVVTMVRGQPKACFEKKSRHARAETLDCLVYAFAARGLLRVSMEQVEGALRNPASDRPARAAEQLPVDDSAAALRERTRNWWGPRRETETEIWEG
jgi:phage terminase large subunit GpA-like protein